MDKLTVRLTTWSQNWHRLLVPLTGSITASIHPEDHMVCRVRLVLGPCFLHPAPGLGLASFFVPLASKAWLHWSGLFCDAVCLWRMKLNQVKFSCDNLKAQRLAAPGTHGPFAMADLLTPREFYFTSFLDLKTFSIEVKKKC
ncbi:hypothetical protein EYF80_009655 [Liparis tanakae]|uniref:Uncharacterized protein n=1 Tax=Liparis tanakae TaxID=230148 RepID=A0A4Z2ISI6_9TELE|nr:hypothetical protein EYF80_009655 [Liparis tanakae]